LKLYIFQNSKDTSMQCWSYYFIYF